MKQKPQLTDAEIRSYMDFDKLLQMSKAASVASSKALPSKITLASYVVGALITVSTVLYIWNKAVSNKPIGIEKNGPSTNEPTRSSIDSTEVKQIEQTIPQVNVKKDSEAIQKPQRKAKPKASEDEKISLSQFTQAEPIEGYAKLYEYLNHDLKYPQEMAKDSIEGTVTVSFAIDVVGKPVNIRITNSLGEAFDKESIRLIESMPAWKAATVNGKPIETRMSIPLTFTIKK